jgi:uncharacterized protein YjiS (DUF1127 family)
MSLNTRSNGHPTWLPWSASLALVRQYTTSTAQTMVALAARRAARRTLKELDHLDDRLLADIGLDRAALAALLRGITKRA